MDEVLEKSGYLKDLELENTVEAQTRIENIDELINKAVSYENSAEDPSLGGFLEEVSLIADIDSWSQDSDYVSLITVHSAKGLEFTNVFLCGMEDGLFPMNAAICSEDETDLEEERRLAYVALTRAKKNLIITASRMRMVRGETIVSIISRFVREIPGELIEPDRENVYISSRQSEYTGSVSASKAGKEAFFRKPYAAGLSSGKFSSAEKKKLDYQEGDTVSHTKFGEGVVAKIADGGRDYEVTVDFKDVGTKKMFASFAKLKKV